MEAETQAEALRATPRYGCAGDAEIVVPGRGLRYAGRIGDLSLGGCFIEVECKLERGTCVEVWMNARGQPLRVAANLMVQKGFGAGLRFLDVPVRKQEQIQSLIAELAEETAARKAAQEEGSEGNGAEVGAPFGGAGMRLMERHEREGGEPSSEKAGRTQVEACGGNFWQRWRRRSRTSTTPITAISSPLIRRDEIEVRGGVAAVPAANTITREVATIMDTLTPGDREEILMLAKKKAGLV